LRHLLIISLCAVVLGGISPARCQFQALADDQTAFTGERIEALHPFGGIAFVPADADIRSFHFEALKAVRVPTRIGYTADPDYCGDALHQSGGSMFCPQTRFESRVAAYRVTYSYTGEPLASDEHGGRRFTLDVYFRPSDLPEPLLQLLAGGKNPGRSRAASYFELTASREPVRRYVSDEARSHSCPGVYIDGNWIQLDDDCDEILRSKAVMAPSDFLTIRVTPVSSSGI
jgi:hypothetical protein